MKPVAFLLLAVLLLLSLTACGQEAPQAPATLGQALLQLCSGMMIRIFRKEEFFVQRYEHESSGDGSIFLSSADLILWDGPEA